MILLDLPPGPVALALFLLFASVTTAHVVTYKRDVRSAIAWVSLIWLTPFIGIALYPILGLNRIHRRAARLPRRRLQDDSGPSSTASIRDDARTPLRRIGDRVTGLAMTAGNRVQLLENGDSAYPAMLEAIESARHRIWLCTYIWKGDETGVRFAEALARAHTRGVEVRLLIDDIGRRHGSRSILSTLRRLNLPVTLFLPLSLSRLRFAFMNLRLHSKLLLVDDRTAFTGGMNLSQNHLLGANPSPDHAVRDLHFQLEGPVLHQLAESFIELWSLASPEDTLAAEIRPVAPMPGLGETSSSTEAVARVVTDGPDVDRERVRWMIHGALQGAKRSIRIQTPYFFPDQPMIHALNAAALRGIEVRILQPARTDLPWALWASRAQWWQLLQKGCSIRLSPGSFDHTKLVIVDDDWLLIGSSNWDPRSWRLNFELNVELESAGLGRALAARFDALEARAQEVRLKDLQQLSYPIRVRDGLARLLLPLL